MDLGLAGANAVVVGGSRGMGRAAARCFADDGARVAVIARSADGFDRVVAELTGRGSPEAFGVAADMTDEAAVITAFDEIARRWDGTVNILVNAASGSVAGTFDTLSDADWRTAVDGGAMGMIHCVRAALPLLRRAEWARIVNFSASSTKRQTVSLVAYTAAKSMVTSVSKNLAQLLAPEEILVNVVSPGSVASEALTGWAKSVGVDSHDPYRLAEAVTEHFGHPAYLPRTGLPEEVGPVVAFLASKRNSYMTGADVNVDGGTDFT